MPTTKGEPGGGKDLVRKVLELERAQGFRDRAAVGGLEAFVARHFPPGANLVRGYASLTKVERAAAVNRLEELLTSPNQGRPGPKDLLRPVEEVPGVGGKRAALLRRLGIGTVEDLLTYFPRKLEDRSVRKRICELAPGEAVTVAGTVRAKSKVKLRPKLELIKAAVDDGTGLLFAVWFNQPWIENQLTKAKQVVLSGLVEQYLGRLVMNSPEWEPLSKKQLHTNRIVPVYPLTKDVTQKWLRGVIHDIVEEYSPHLPDPLPENIRVNHSLTDLPHAIREIHFPDSDQSLQKAKQRLAFEELFLMQMGVLNQKRQWESRSGTSFESPEDWLLLQLESLPFKLTNAQKRALDQVRADLSSGTPMNRLLQGDVGSGKTVVAALAALIVIHGGAQAAFLAPTSILAEQHFQSLKKLLTQGSGDLAENQIALLIGATPENEKADIRKQLADGKIKLIIGTHALLQDPVRFQSLQLAIVDEQHRFGVEQRGTLRQKGNNPHLLVMTATPIPRSLALTIYGDLELSVINEMPPGRIPVETHLLNPSEIERAFGLVRGQVDKGNQAFIVYPLVEESDKIDEKSAVDEFNRLQKEVFPSYKLGLLHGQLSPAEKEEVMIRFRDKEIQILVSTSIVEVGLDIPDATVMLVEGAHRFGLAQLHQFRGRVGRGEHQSYCLLVADDISEKAVARLEVMESTSSGFDLAEADLKFLH